MNRAPSPSAPGRRRARGVALLEALIASVILAIGLLGAIGLQARAYSALADASMRVEATMAGEKLFGVMSNDLGNLNAYALGAGAAPDPRLATWLTETRAAIPGAVVTVAVTPQVGTTRSRIDIVIGWTRKNGGPANAHRVTAYLAAAT